MMKLNRFTLQYIGGFFLVIWFLISHASYDEFFANILRLIGFLCVVIGVIGRIYATVFIGGMKNEGVDGKSFIDYGAYSLCRNPLYFFSFIGFIGLLALKAQILLIIIGALFYLGIYKMTILKEEEFLSSQFKEKYQDFLNSTTRFFPKWSNFHCPEKIEVRPAFLHKELLRAINWFLGVLIILFVETLHYYEILPNLYTMF